MAFGKLNIPLTKGKNAVIDECSKDTVSRYIWHFDGKYAATNTVVNGKRKKIRMHRLLLDAPSGLDIDHINGDRLDNRLTNLRVCTRSQNLRNQGLRSNNSSGYRGITYYKPYKKWAAQIYIDGKNKRIGYFDDLASAVDAYNEDAKKYYKNFARIQEFSNGVR